MVVRENTHAPLGWYCHPTCLAGSSLLTANFVRYDGVCVHVPARALALRDNSGMWARAAHLLTRSPGSEGPAAILDPSPSPSSTGHRAHTTTLNAKASIFPAAARLRPEWTENATQCMGRNYKTSYGPVQTHGPETVHTGLCSRAEGVLHITAGCFRSRRCGRALEAKGGGTRSKKVELPKAVAHEAIRKTPGASGTRPGPSRSHRPSPSKFNQSRGRRVRRASSGAPRTPAQRSPWRPRQHTGSLITPAATSRSELALVARALPREPQRPRDRAVAAPGGRLITSAPPRRIQVLEPSGSEILLVHRLGVSSKGFDRGWITAVFWTSLISPPLERPHPWVGPPCGILGASNPSRRSTLNPDTSSNSNPPWKATRCSRPLFPSNLS